MLARALARGARAASAVGIPGGVAGVPARFVHAGEEPVVHPDDYEFHPPQFTKRRGLGIVHDPVVNKGTAFSLAERDRLHIRGIVPPRELGMEVQTQKILNGFRRCETDVEKHLFLQGLQDRNETLFYKALLENIEEMAPIVYTPVVGKVCQEFGNLFRRTRGEPLRPSNG
jgi:malate dehydrogenase (oxaloacetate-decarboxylating)(NADP+)